MNADHEWSITKEGGGVVRVIAEGWQIGPNGDLLFANGLNGLNPFCVRAFAKGTWREVNIYT
jgi:hypothetical protein